MTDQSDSSRHSIYWWAALFTIASAVVAILTYVHLNPPASVPQQPTGGARSPNNNTPLLQMAPAFVGDWTGPVNSSNANGSFFAANLHIKGGSVGSVVGTFELPTERCSGELLLDKATKDSAYLTMSAMNGSYYGFYPGWHMLLSIDNTSNAVTLRSYLTQPDSPSATATLVPPQASGSLQQDFLLQVAAVFVGDWTGPVNPSSASGSFFAATLHIKGGGVGAVVGTFELPTERCTGELLLDKATKNSIYLTMSAMNGSYYGFYPGWHMLLSIDNASSTVTLRSYLTEPDSPSATATLVRKP
jgi:hypothetical protein